MSRLVGGSAGGRRLAAPAGGRTRPTSERAREGLFNTLATLVVLDGARVADLYAGTGAVGLEALSRGAAHALLVERDPVVLRTLRRNVASVGLPGAEVVAGEVAAVVAGAPPGGPYDVVFLDPPYAVAVDGVLRAVADGGWLRPGGVCAVERATRDAPLTWPDGLCTVRHRRYGEGTLWYGLRS